MAQRRIGVLTFHRSFNYGSYWQARCLVEGLGGLGHRVEILDHDSPEVNRAEGRCLLQPTLPERTPRADFSHYKIKGRKLIAAADALPRSPRFHLHDAEAVGGYDVVVVGSDEVWNFQHPWYGGKTIFFGGGVRAGRLVSYAASFGNHDAAIGLHPHWAERLGGFSAISVRDANSAQLVRGATGTEPALVLDPCLQFADRIDSVAAEEPVPYALVYGHGFPVWLAAALRRWSAGAGLRLLSVGYRNDWADEHRLGAGPHEFAGLMAGAAAVVTNFFHGCVFALVNHKPFVTAPSAYRFNKVRDLASALGAEHHIVTHETPDSRLHHLLGAAPDDAIGSRIARLRARSHAFLDAALA